MSARSLPLAVALCLLLGGVAYAQVTTLDPIHPYGVSLTIGSDGLGLISYIDGNAGLKVAHCSNLACTSATITLLDDTASPGPQTSIATSADGLGLIAYDAATGMWIAHCSNVLCTQTTAYLVSTQASGPQVVVGSDGLGLVAGSFLSVPDGTTPVAHCNDVPCTSTGVPAFLP